MFVFYKKYWDSTQLNQLQCFDKCYRTNKVNKHLKYTHFKNIVQIKAAAQLKIALSMEKLLVI